MGAGARQRELSRGGALQCRRAPAEITNARVAQLAASARSSHDVPGSIPGGRRRRRMNFPDTDCLKKAQTLHRRQRERWKNMMGPKAGVGGSARTEGMRKGTGERGANGCVGGSVQYREREREERRGREGLAASCRTTPLFYISPSIRCWCWKHAASSAISVPQLLQPSCLREQSCQRRARSKKGRACDSAGREGGSEGKGWGESDRCVRMLVCLALFRCGGCLAAPECLKPLLSKLTAVGFEPTPLRTGA